MAGWLTRREPESLYKGWEKDSNRRDGESVADIKNGKEVRLWVLEWSPDLWNFDFSVKGIVRFFG